MHYKKKNNNNSHSDFFTLSIFDLLFCLWFFGRWIPEVYRGFATVRRPASCEEYGNRPACKSVLVRIHSHWGRELGFSPTIGDKLLAGDMLLSR